MDSKSYEESLRRREELLTTMIVIELKYKNETKICKLWWRVWYLSCTGVRKFYIEVSQKQHIFGKKVKYKSFSVLKRKRSYFIHFWFVTRFQGNFKSHFVLFNGDLYRYLKIPVLRKENTNFRTEHVFIKYFLKRYFIK